MCGIAGCYWFELADGHPKDRPLDQALLLLRHRGPDGQGVFLDGPLAMGMRRLAVIDVQGGWQPVYNEDKTVAVVYNGELYNYRELRDELKRRGHRFSTNSDTEVLVHAYEEWGEAFLRRLNGMFAFSLWDGRSQKVLLARDQIGIKPLYWIRTPQYVAWASEIKALFPLVPFRPSLNVNALPQFLRFGYVPAPNTLLESIEKFPPATVAVIDHTGVRLQRYWHIRFDHPPLDEQAWCEELRSLLDEAVRRQLVSDVPLGAFLSGGLDSSTIVATMHRLGVDHIATYSIGFGEEDAFFNELPKARRLARHLRTDHHEILVRPQVAELIPRLLWHLDEPMTDSSFIVTYLVSELARQTVTVILSGVGGDELFGGYRRYLWPYMDAYYHRIPKAVRRRVLNPLLHALPVDRGSRLKSLVRYARSYCDGFGLPEGLRYQRYVGVFTDEQLRAVLSPEVMASLDGMLATDVADRYNDAPSDDPFDRMLYADLCTALVDSLLTFTDKMSMAVSLEARVPLLDLSLVEWAARLPGRLRCSGPQGLKYLFKKAVSDRLPPDLLRRRKQGFGTPIGRWFRGHLRPLLEEYLSPSRLRRNGLFDPQSVRQLVKEHLTEQEDHTEHLTALLTFEIWSDLYLRGRP